jgi:TolA-binding protein
MLRAKKKITQKVIKEDKLVTTYYQARNWYDLNKKRVSTGIGVAVVIVIAVWFYINNMRTNNEKAATDLAKVMTYVDNGQYQVAVDGIPEKNIPGLQGIVENYGSTKAGNMAKFYLATAYYGLQNYDKAIEHFDDYSGGNELFEISALSGLGACYEAKGNLAEAAEYYEKAALKNSDDPNAAENLINAARNFVRIGQKEHATELYKKVKTDYSTAPQAREIDRYIAEATM